MEIVISMRSKKLMKMLMVELSKDKVDGYVTLSHGPVIDRFRDYDITYIHFKFSNIIIIIKLIIYQILI